MLLSSTSTQLKVLTGKLCLIELLAWGVLYYTFAVYLSAMQRDLGWSSATLAGGFSVALLVSGLSAPFVGAWVDRHGSRGLIALGALVGSFGVSLWSIAFTLPTYFAGWVLIGLGMASTLYPPAFATVVRTHPEDSRKAILTITVIGALSSTIFMPLASVLGDWLGWRGGLQVLAGAMAVVVTLLAFSLPSKAAASIVHNDHKVQEDTPRAPGSFRLLVSTLMIADVASVAVNVHLVLFLVDHGQSLQAAASIAGLAGAAKIGGRLATAAGARVSAMTLMRASLVLTSAALMIPLLWPSTWSAILMVIGFGATNGARTILRPAIIVEMYGPRRFGKSNGLLQLFTTGAKSAGPLGFAVLLGAFGWSWAWPALAVLLLASAALLMALRPNPAKAHTDAADLVSLEAGEATSQAGANNSTLKLETARAGSAVTGPEDFGERTVS
ncbi:MAG: MFS transporter [Planctomycetota bacterium]